ncbi:MAG: YcaO-like family protein [Candidatus Moranbacteria bacterium]|nr:YcaO-like family protein [Candidatus Moranbacteria bacterium]MBP9801486.1 YcaO-like family protein [Candidatus Moranbacteria bacterium]
MSKKYTHSELFHRPGYLSVREYLEDINSMRKSGKWKLPLGIIDRVHFFFLSYFVRFSRFSASLFILHSKDTSPAYSVLLEYLRRKQFFDVATERDLHYPGYYFYFSTKKISFKNRTLLIWGQGVANDKSVALSKALGEIIERVISGIYDKNTFVVNASPEEVMEKFPVIYPPKYHRFLDQQKERFPELRYSQTDVLTWVTGRNLITQERTYIPINITSWCSQLQPRGVGDKIIVHATTNGSAGYFTKEGAVLRGLLEVVQRDAFLVHWLTTIPPEIILQESLPDSLRHQIQVFESIGISLFILHTTTLSIPSVLVAAVNAESETPGVTITAASAMTLEEAIQDALREMIIGIEIFYYKDPVERQKYAEAEFEPFVSRLDKISRQFYWHGKERVDRFQWFCSGKCVSYAEACRYDLRCIQDDKNRLKTCLKVLKKLGSDYYPVVYYPKNSIQETLGFFVAQVYIPKAFPLYLFEGYGTFKSERLQEFAESRNVSDWKLNPLPHGFS